MVVQDMTVISMKYEGTGEGKLGCVFPPSGFLPIGEGFPVNWKLCPPGSTTANGSYFAVTSFFFS